MAKIKTIVTTTLLAFAASPALAQLGPCVATDPPFLAEGPIEAATANADGSGTVTAMGITITVPAGTPVHTPTADLGGMAGFADATPFPGRTQPGFIGGTVIATGCVKTDAAGNQVYLADDVSSDVSENVLLGVVTRAPASNEAPVGFDVLGTPVSLLGDARMPAEHLRNTFGFEVVPATVPVGASAAVEGYFGSDGSGVLHVWAVEVGGGELADPVKPQISVLRSRCDGDLRVQGAVYLGDADGVAPAPACTFGSPPYAIKLYNADANQEIPFVDRDELTVTAGVAPDTQFCSYAMRLRSIGDAACPPNVRVDLLLDGNVIATATTAKEAPAPNALPVAVADGYAVVGGQTLTIAAPGLLANDSDADAGDTLAAILVANAQNGELVFGADAGPADGSFAYTPEPGFSGTDTFIYRAVDSKGGLSEPVTVSIVVTAAGNLPPVANPDTVTTPEDTALTIPVASLLANDDDPNEEATLSVVAVGNAVNGSVALNGADVVFTPAANFNGTAGFSYTLSDGEAAATGNVTVNVTPVNDAPVAQNDTAATAFGTAVTVNVLGNDSDVEGDALTVSSLTQPAAGSGSVALDATQTAVVYTPAAGFSGTTSFSYRARDAAGALSNIATATVTVAPPAVVVDLDIGQLSVPGTLRVGQLARIRLAVRNGGSVDQARNATIVGVRNGVEVYNRTLAVRDAVGGGTTTFEFPSYTPNAPGAISWTATIADDNADLDRATALTNVR